MNKKNNKFLIIRFGAIGDVVHTTALFRAIKKTLPEIQIHYLTFKVPSELLQNDHDIDKVYVLEDKSYKNIFKMAKDLKKEQYDLVLNLQPSARTRILNLLIRPKKQLTYKKTYKMHAVANFWSTAKPMFSTLGSDDYIYIYVPEKIKGEIKNKLNPDGRKLICFNMGVSPDRHGRKWPLEYWIKLGMEIKNKHNARLILSGGPNDVKEGELLVKNLPFVESFCGKLSILETAALMSLCNVVISGDTGPLHIGTAVGTNCIGLYGGAPVSRTGPYGKKHLVAESNLACVPCAKRTCRFNETEEDKTPCMESIQPEQVLKLVEKLLLN